MARGQRAYTERDKAQALSALDSNAGNLSATSRVTGIPFATIKEWRNGRGISADVPAKTLEAKQALGDMFERVVREAVAAITTEKLADAPVHHLTTAAGTAFDKMRLARGEATAITDDLSTLDDSERAARIDAIFDAARARRDSRAHGERPN